MNALSPTRSGVISSPDPRDQGIIQGQSGSPVIDQQISRFDQDKVNDSLTFEETSQTNTLGEEDFIPDTEGSQDDHPRKITGDETKKVSRNKQKNVPN